MTASTRPVSDMVDAWLRKQVPEGVCLESPDRAASFEMIPVSDLIIDGHYQRSMSAKGRSTVARIIAEFDWLRFGAISVVRKDGKLSVVDGQHRAVAAAAMGIQDVPAMVAVGEAAEAATFVAINDVRTAVTPVDKFRAKVAAGDPDALELGAMLAELEISTDVLPGIPLRPRQTRSISVLYKLIKAHGRGIVFTALEMLTDGQPDNADALTSLNIEAVTIVTAKVIAAKGDIDRLATVIEESDFEQIADNARQLSKISGGSNKSHAAFLLLRTYDKGLKGGRIGSSE
ncbi:hypothetical protein RGQ15_07020 [Paracoccus sp. MBLB3053]|uniref:ParB-like N-terminal domain-containing protein n=1 Tax=Paracoccus aurantius TaxID=3073814 RepID=A0ABU2HQJ3_9RHOB|nr:DUF6551 family protein [Paracoccus sp. MBLB3053]MDS9467324.1 hypothetical protein [Paracoccus sp. MBLB3053]